MNIESAIRSMMLVDVGVESLVKTRIYPMQVPQGEAFPRIVYRVDETRDHTLSGPDGKPVAEFAISVQSLRYDEMLDVADAVTKCLDGFRGPIGSCFVNGILVTSREDEIDPPVDASEQSVYTRTINATVHYQD